LGGVIMCYRKLKFLDKTGRMSYNPPGISFRVQVQLLLFSPGPKSVLRGEVKEIQQDHLDLVVYKVFNARILKKRINSFPLKDVKIGDEIEFNVLGYDNEGGQYVIQGMLNENSKLIVNTKRKEFKLSDNKLSKSTSKTNKKGKKRSNQEGENAAEIKRNKKRRKLDE
jgi:hypothetical protein